MICYFKEEFEVGGTYMAPKEATIKMVKHDNIKTNIGALKLSEGKNKYYELTIKIDVPENALN